MQKCTKRLCCTAWCITTSNQLIQYTVCIDSSSSELSDVHGQHQHVTACLQCTKSTVPFPPSTQRCMSHSTGQLTAAQHSTAQHSTAQHSTSQHSTAQRSSAQHSTAQHSTAQHSTAQHSTAQHSSIQLQCKQQYGPDCSLETCACAGVRCSRLPASQTTV